MKGKLFNQMITSKGAMGNGLGIYISNSVIKAKFNGRMWTEDNPEGARFLESRFRCNMLALQRCRKEGKLNEENRVAPKQTEISILALDDDRMMTLTLQSYFQSSGYHIDVEK